MPEGLKPGTWLTTEASMTEQETSPLPTFHPVFEKQLAVAHEMLEIRGFFDSRGGRAAVVLMTRAQEGFCVLNAWMSPANESLTHIELVSMWRARDGQRAMLLVETSSTRSEIASQPAASHAVVLGTNAQRVWKAFESNSMGLAFDPQPNTVALLGAGEPLFLDSTGQFHARPAPKDSATGPEGTPPACPKTPNKPLGEIKSDPNGDDSDLAIGQWIPTDEASKLYRYWDTDDRAKVVFRKLLTVDGQEVEAAGIAGMDAVVVFLSPASKGFCVLNSRYWAWGGNGVYASSSWWLPKNQKLAVLLLGLTFEYHHGVAPEDPREESGGIALTLDGLRVRRASEKELALAQASQTPK
ncbi:MAG: hypothetical protein ACJ8AT_35970 [Hyalangium sp.]|uniref:hypothetical protein n=1 Tax=Hyalangium sp. TaxID=2028555 RepID=UPI00389A2CF4